MSVRLTSQTVRDAEAPEAGLNIVWDNELKGFGLRVTPGGTKAFILDYRAGRRQRRMTIGRHPDWTVAAAREEAKKLRRDVSLGGDPMDARHEDRGAPSIEDLWRRYRDQHLIDKAQRSQKDQISMWEKIILPFLSRKQLKGISHADIDALHRHITIIRGTPIRANRTIEVLKAAFNLAIRWGWLEHNPAIGVRRNDENKRERYFSEDELRRLQNAMTHHSQRTSIDAILLIILTGARKGEVLNATWDQFDLQQKIWIKPASNTKQRKVHRVPLSDDAVELLVRRRSQAEGPFVFSGQNPDEPLKDIKKTWATLCKEAKLTDARIHDLRHTYASILVSSGASLPLIGALLGHTQPSTTARYAHLYDEPLREATEKVSRIISRR
jgi:integrase